MKYIRPILTSYAYILFIIIAAWGCGPKTPEQKQKIMMAALNSPEGKEAFNEVVRVMDETLRPIHTSEDIEILCSSMDPFYEDLEQDIKHFFMFDRKILTM